MQFKAGYISDSIAKVITDFKNKLDKTKTEERNKLLQINGKTSMPHIEHLNKQVVELFD